MKLLYVFKERAPIFMELATSLIAGIGLAVSASWPDVQGRLDGHIRLSTVSCLMK